MPSPQHYIKPLLNDNTGTYNGTLTSCLVFSDQRNNNVVRSLWDPSETILIMFTDPPTFLHRQFQGL